MLISKISFIQRSFRRQYQNMVIEITRPLSLSTKLKNVVTEKHDLNGLFDTYERAISTLNALQSNASTIAHSVEQRKHNVHSTHIQETEKYLERSGIDFSDLDRLSVIHVTGTKGKGSTCAFTESILRSFGIKTGFFSSPHLVSVTERIRLNGQPISRDMFAKYFWKVYQSLDKNKEHINDMPPYFKFLTVMSFHIFLAEQVDVVILEVGIGGEHDCTNVVRNTKTVGITSLGLEHTAILGNTLEDIAWQKSGIIKENSNVFTINQHEECLEIIRERCAERNAKLHIIPAFKDYRYTNSHHSIIDTVCNEVQQLNASLGIQLSWDWLRRNSKMLKNPKLIKTLKYNSTEPFLNITNEFIVGLQNFSWPGRFQILHRKELRLFIDGAHTIDSLQVCLDWFKKKVHGSSNRKFLLFNVTGDRDAEAMLQILGEDGIFDFAMFSPNVATQIVKQKDDSYTVLQQNNGCEKCMFYAAFWNNLMNLNLSQNNVLSTKSKNFDSFNSDNISFAQIFHSVVDVFSFLDNECATNKESIDVLVTGSLHLVGATLAAIHFKE